MKISLNWSYKETITLAGKLFQTWEQEGMAMAHGVVYLVKVYNILMSLIVNANQIGVHLVPIGGDRTWERLFTHMMLTFKKQLGALKHYYYIK